MCVVFLSLSVALAGATYWVWDSSAQFRNDCVVVPATVVALSGRERGTSPTVEYRWNNEVHRWTSSISTRPPSYAVGDPVTMLVDPANPSDATIDDWMHRWLTLVMLGVFTLVMMICTAVAVVLGFVVR